MSQDIVLTLLQVVALALPAVGIYLQVLRDLHRPNPDDSIGIDTTSHMLDFNLAKSGLLIIGTSGVIDVVYLLIVQTPPLGTGLGAVILPSLLILSLVLVGIGMFVFVGSVYFSFGTSLILEQNPSMYTTLYTFVISLYKIFHPKKTL